MANLLKGLNAITWTVASQAIPISDLAPYLVAAYTINPQTGLGYVSYKTADAVNNLTVFIQGYPYLVEVSQDCTTGGAVAAPAGSFASFPGYTPVAPAVVQAGASLSSSTSGVAAEPIIGGRLVAQTPAGLVLYSARTLIHKHLLLGLAMNSALAGGSVTVLRGGYGLYPGLGLPLNVTLFAGDRGQMAPTTAGMAFCQVVGRPLSADELIFRPESIVLLAQ